MLHEKPLHYDPVGDDGDGTNRAWTGEKRRRKYLLPSSSDAPAVTVQDHQDQISPATDMEGIIQGVQAQELLARLESDPQEEDLWGPEVDISPDDVATYTKCLADDIPPVYTRSMMTAEEQDALDLRLARYRITYYKNVEEQQSACKLKDPEDYSEDELLENGYFRYLEKHESFEGCFHRPDTYVAELDDYQRLLVKNGLPDCSDGLYIYWEDYHAYYRTYEVDEAYVKYYGELSIKIKWLKDYLDLDCKSEKWIYIATRAWRQALKIAASHFTKLSANLAGMAFDEYISELREDKFLANRFLFYFNVWKIYSLKKGSLRDAVEEAYEINKSILQIEGIMDDKRKAQVISIFEHKFTALTLVAGITANTDEGEARDLLRKTFFKKFKQKNMAKYAKKKLEIAALMKLGLGRTIGLLRTMQS